MLPKRVRLSTVNSINKKLKQEMNQISVVNLDALNDYKKIILAIAGSKLIGFAIKTDKQNIIKILPSWHNKGIEEEFLKILCEN